MYAEDLVVDDYTQGKEVEHVREIMPDISIAILSSAFCVEPIRLSNAARLVIAANEVNAMGVS